MNAKYIATLSATVSGNLDELAANLTEAGETVYRFLAQLRSSPLDPPLYPLDLGGIT